MRELVYDVRSNGLLLLLKVVIIVVVLIGLYNVLSLSEDTDRAIDQSFTEQENYHLYTVVDTLADPELFYDFRNSPET